MEFTVNGKQIEITETEAIFNGDKLTTLLLHDCDDEYNDGDCITADYVAMPENDEEAETLVNNTYWATYWHRDEKGTIICDE